jgi:GT2 family glycosyltransferase
MKLNFDFLANNSNNSNQENSIPYEDSATEVEKIQCEKYFSNNKENEVDENLPLADFKILTNIRNNIINWYEFEKNATVLDLNPNFGEILNCISEKVKSVIAISQSKIKASAIMERLIKVNNLEVIVGDLSSIKLNNKFDYVTIIGIKDKLELVQKLNFAKEYLAEDGKILVAFDNKFGMKYWSGIKEENLAEYDSILGKTGRLSLVEAEKILKELEFNYKTYYPLPDYTLTNVIYSDEYLPDEESMMARNLVYFDENEYCEFSQREAYIQLLKTNPEYFKIFANSYFIEISKEEITNDIRYVNFEIYRRDEYNIRTVIKKDFVYKYANVSSAKEHINSIKDNIKLLKSKNIKTLDEYDSEKIISKFAHNAISYDKYILKICKEEGKEEAIKALKKFTDKIAESFLIINTPKNNIFTKYNIEVSDELLNELHFVKDGLLDLCTQNCFYIDNELYIYDQEWHEENVPIEFIYYRNIFYINNLYKYIPREELFKIYNLEKYVELFEQLDTLLQNNLRNSYVWNLHCKSVAGIGKKGRTLLEKNSELENLKIINNDLQIKEDELGNIIKKLVEKNKELSEEINSLNKNSLAAVEKVNTEKNIVIQNLNNQLENTNNQLAIKNNQINDYARQLQIMEKSLSWRLTSPFRYIAWVFNFKNKMKLVDRLMPPGSNMRARHEEKKHTRILNSLAKTFMPYTDSKTAKYWALIVEKENEENIKPINDYYSWILNNEPTKEELEGQRKVNFKINPKISIIIPLYNTPVDFFRELLYFMHEQTYTNWELCLADGSPEPLKEIQKMVAKEPRIKYKYIGKNKGISENTNEALSLATGDYIGLLDHDDYLSKDCLYEVVKCINENSKVEFIYTDEDKVAGVGEERYDAYFKPDFAPDTLRSQNYICHFSVFKKELMKKLGGFRSEFDGAQDYDIFLRMSEITNIENIKHISKILYHWRIHKASTAMQGSAKPWAFEAGRNALENHIARIGLKATVKNGVALGTYEVQYEVQGNPKVSIIIPNKDGIDILKVCIESILEKTTYENYEINIVENNSTEEETFEYYKEIEKNPKINVLYYPDEGFNYSKIINFGVKNSDSDFIMQLNNDTELITENWLQIMIGYCQRKEIGAVGIKLYYPDKTVQHAGVLLGMGGIAGHLFKFIGKDDFAYFSKAVMIQDMTAVTAACIMTRREIYEEVGYMNEKLAVAFNDIDFCLKIRQAGYLIIYNPYVEILHYESKSRGEENTPEKVKRFNNEINIFKKDWQKTLDKGDPYYNVNLRLDNDQCAIRTDIVNNTPQKIIVGE